MTGEHQEKKLTDRTSGLDIPKEEWERLGKIVNALAASCVCADYHRGEAQAALQANPDNQAASASLELRLESRRIHHKQLIESFLGCLTRLSDHFERLAK